MPRERYQDPTICQNANGSFYIKVWMDVVDARGLTRKQRRIVLGPVSMGKRAAMAAKTQAMDRINRASYVIQSQIDFAELLKIYDKRHVAKLADPTQKKYRSLITNHIAKAFDKLKLYEITGARVDEWIAAKAETYSWSTRTDIRNILSSIFTCAKHWKLFDDENPIAGVYVGRKRLIREKKKLSDDQMRKLLAALPGDVRLMVMVALFCTLRISEVLGLQEKHIDFEAGLIHVRQRFYRGNLDVVKGQKSERSVPMGYLSDALKALCGADPERFVFSVRTSRPGRPSVSRDDRDILQHFIRPAAKALNCYTPGFGWHSFRREAITAISASLGIGQAMSAAGHSTADMSLAYTLQDRAELDRAIRDRQDNLMGETKGRPV